MPTLDDVITINVYDRGVSTPAAHAASHAAAGSDPLTLSSGQITGLGTMATQAAGAVAITGGAIAGVTISSSGVTFTGGTMTGVAITAGSATLSGGTIDGMVIGGSAAANATFLDVVTDDLVIGGDLTLLGSVTLAAPLPLTAGGTGATGASQARLNLGIGSLGTQGAGSVSISGGSITATTINGCVIGGSSPAAGTFTAITGVGMTLTATAAINTLTLTNALGEAYGGTGATTYAAARANLGLVIGTNVQAYDADLAAIAALTSAADRMIYYTGAGTAALLTTTSYGRSLLNSADAAAARSTLGVTDPLVKAVASATLVGGTVTVVDSSIAADSIVVPIHDVISGTPGFLSVVITAGVGFDINSSSGTDASDLRVNIIY